MGHESRLLTDQQVLVATPGAPAHTLALGSEGVALAGVAALKAAIEPADALLRGAVSEGLGADVAASHLLEAVVADGGGSVKT